MEFTELDLLIQAKETLSCIPINKQSVEYENVNFNINSVIHKRCNHDIVFDNIDIDIERCETICYCTKCSLTFTVQFIKDYMLSTLDHDKREQWKIITNNGIFDLVDIYVKDNWLHFQIWCPGWNNPSNTIKFNLKDVLHSTADKTIIYINN
tara:strand:- start:384 stop:839 length:456 start_codon:yes stop_codon:yes gene_type:complete